MCCVSNYLFCCFNLLPNDVILVEEKLTQLAEESQA